MLPAATLVFLDELFNANSAILNCLLTVLNERFFRRGREAFAIPALTFVGASNRLPEDEILRALFDRFLLRVGCDNVPGDRLSEVAAAGWRLDLALEPPRDRVDTQDIRRLHNRLRDVNFDLLRPSYVELIHRLRRAGIEISDRRAVKCQRLVAASALLCDRSQADLSDLWVLRYIWDAEEQQEILREIVQEFVERDDSTVARHPRARHDDRPDPEQLARDLDHLRSRLEASDPASEEATQLNDQLGLLAGRCEWVTDESAREFLQQRLAALWRLQGSTAGVAER